MFLSQYLLYKNIYVQSVQYSSTCVFKDAARPKLRVHDCGVTQRSAPANSLIFAIFTSIFAIFTPIVTLIVAPGALFKVLTLIWQLMWSLILLFYCLTTQFYTFLEARGTRSCIRVHGSGVLGIFLIIVQGVHPWSTCQPFSTCYNNRFLLSKGRNVRNVVDNLYLRYFYSRSILFLDFF